MKTTAAFLASSFAFLLASPFSASAQSTYTLTNGEVNLVAGLTNLTTVTAINATNQSVGIDYITDSSWSATGISDLGWVGGSLAGTFGGANYFASLNNVILIGVGSATSAWGTWTVRLLLSNDIYSSAINYTNSDLVRNQTVRTDAGISFFNNRTGSTVTPGVRDTYYQLLNIADFDTENIGVKGIELSNMGAPFPDMTYIGVTEPVPEPSTYALLALAAAGVGAHVLRRRRK